MPYRTFIVVGFWLLLLLTNNSGCLNSKLVELEFFSVSTEPVAPQSLALIKLTGRVDNLIDQKVEACGFIWSNDEAAISGPAPLGGFDIPATPPNGNGAFEYNFSVPEGNKVYFFRAYATLGERRVFADVIRSYALGGVVLQTGNWHVDNDTAWVQGILVGLNATKLTVDSFGHVLSETNSMPELGCGDCKSTHNNASNDDGAFSSKFDGLKFNTPYFARAYAFAGGKHFYSTKIDTIVVNGGWKRVDNFRQYHDGVAVSDETHGQAFVAFGCEDNINCAQGSLPADVWAMKAGVDKFEKATEFPGLLKRTNTSAFVIDDALYFIFGEYYTDASSGSFFVYDCRKYSTSNGSWTTLTSPGTSCPRRSKAVAFSLLGKGYVGTGSDQDGGALQDFWEYTPATGSWRQVASLPGRISAGQPMQNIGRIGAVAFKLENDAVYVGGGIVGGTMLYDFWKFIPPAPNNPNDIGSWEFCCFFDKGLPRIEAISFGIKNKGYYGLGFSSTNDVLNDLYEFDPTVPSWTKRENFPGGKRRGALGFSLNGFGYAGCGFERVITNVVSEALRADMWKYEPKK